MIEYIRFHGDHSTWEGTGEKSLEKELIRCKDCKHLFSWGSFSEHYCEFDVKEYSDRRLKDKWSKACDKFESRRC